MQTALVFADKRLPAFLFLAVFGFLLYCAAPTLYWGDSAEMVSVGCSLGVAHSPGYPLYSQAAGLFTLLPLEPLPFRVNVLSIFLMTAAILLVYGTVAELSGSKAAGFMAVIGLIGCRAFVFYSLMTEVYALHVLLFSGALYLFAKHSRTGNDTQMLGALFLVFAGVTHHLLMIFALIAVIVYLAIQPGHKWRVAAGPLLFLLGVAMINLFRAFDALPLLTTIGFWTLVGLGVLYAFYVAYLIIRRLGAARALATASAVVMALAAATMVFGYLPLASARGPAVDWWSPRDPINFLNLLFLRGYESTLPSGKLEWLRRFDLNGLLTHAPLIILAVGIPGLILLMRKRWRVGVLLLVTALGTLGGTLFVQHGKPEALRMPVYETAYILAGIGVAAVPGWRLFRGKAWKRALGAAGAVIVVGLFVFNLRHSDWRYMNRSDGAYVLGRQIISDVRTNSFLFLGVQTPSIMGYFRACEPGELSRKDIVVVPVSFLPYGWQIEQLEKQYRDVRFPTPAENDEDREIFRVDDPARSQYGIDLMKANPERAAYADFLFIPREMGWITVPHGAVYQMLPKETTPERVAEIFAADRMPKWSGLPKRDATSALNIASVYNERGKIYLQTGVEGGDQLLIGKSIKEFNKALDLYPDYADALSNKGQALFFFRQARRGLKLMEKAITLAPTDPRMYEALATALFRQQTKESIQKAIGLWQMAFVLDKHNARALHNIGSAMVGIQQKEYAIQYYKQALQVDPGYISAYINVARVYNQLKMCAPAVEALETAKDRSPNRIDIRSELAQQYHDCNMQHLYAQVVDEMIADFPHDVELFYTLGIIFRNVGQYDNLVRAIKELRALDPEFPIQKMFDTLDTCEKAVKVIRQVIQRMPEEQELYYILAVKYGVCDMPKEAVSTVEAAARKFPQQKMFKYLLVRLHNRNAIPRKLPEGVSPYDLAMPQGK